MYQAPHYTTNILSSASLFLFILDLALPSMPPLLRGRRLLPPPGGRGLLSFFVVFNFPESRHAAGSPGYGPVALGNDVPSDARVFGQFQPT